MTVGKMSLYELLSTAAALARMDREQDPSYKPAVSEEDWRSSMDVITELARFDPTICLE